MQTKQSDLKALVGTSRESSRLFGELNRAAAKASAQSSSTLIGVVGGLIGMATAYVLSFVTPGSSVEVLAAIFTGLGIVGGVLIYRGGTRLNFEKRLEENRIAAEEIMSRIKALPRNTPPAVRDELWATYQMLNSISVIMNRGPQALPSSSIPVAVLKDPAHAKLLVSKSNTPTDDFPPPT